MRNYPGCGDPNEDPTTPPNYFYYYCQTAAKYGSPGYGYISSHETKPWETTNGCPPYPYHVESWNHRSGHQIPTPGANQGDWLNYIDRFAWACRHEAKHGEDYTGWWSAGCYSRTNDVDDWGFQTAFGDAMPNNVETNTSYAGEQFDPNNPKTFANRYGVPNWDDDQLYTCLNAVVWTKEQQDASYADDWAKPGKNWPDRQ